MKKKSKKKRSDFWNGRAERLSISKFSTKRPRCQEKSKNLRNKRKKKVFFFFGCDVTYVQMNRVSLIGGHFLLFYFFFIRGGVGVPHTSGFVLPTR